MSPDIETSTVPQAFEAAAPLSLSLPLSARLLDQCLCLPSNDNEIFRTSVAVLKYLDLQKRDVSSLASIALNSCSASDAKGSRSRSANLGMIRKSRTFKLDNLIIVMMQSLVVAMIVNVKGANRAILLLFVNSRQIPIAVIAWSPQHPCRLSSLKPLTQHHYFAR